MNEGIDTFIARQPIFDRQVQVHGYELLHRSGQHPEFQPMDPDRATLELLSASMLVNRLQDLTDHKLGFVNVTENLLRQDLIQVLPKEHTVLEVLETVRPTAEVVDAVRALRSRGHRIALDDFEGHESWAPLVELAQYIKVDFLSSTPEQRRALLERWRRPGLSFLAEKIESRQDFEEARDLGYEFFQGYFFCRPETSRRRDLPRSKAHTIQFLQEIARPTPDLDALEEIIKHEISLSAKLLRYLNSAYFGVRSEITSIRQALVHLGERPLKRWGTLIALSGLGDDKPLELVRTCLVRARFCEQLASTVGLDERSLDLFLTGMFSALDALTDRPLDEALVELGVSPDIQAAISGAEGDLAPAYSLARACEEGDVRLYKLLSTQFRLQEVEVARMYAEALFWADDVFSIGAAA